MRKIVLMSAIAATAIATMYLSEPTVVKQAEAGSCSTMCISQDYRTGQCLQWTTNCW